MKKFLKKIVFKIFPSIKFKRSGERQVSSDLSDIRADHKGRYKFAAQFIKPGMNVLDVACGVGYGSYIIAKAHPQANCLGIDLEDRAIDFAKEHYKLDNNEFLVGNALNLNLDEDSFDAVLSFETIEHLPQPEIFLNNVSRLIKPGGSFLVSSPNQSTLSFIKEKFPFHLRHFTGEELSGLLKEAGFEVNKIYSQPEKESESVNENDTGLYLIIHAKRIN